MAETLKPKRGRPQGREATADEVNAELERLVLKRIDREADIEEAANNRMRRAIRRQKEQEANLQEWIEYRNAQGHRHLALAREQFEEKTRLVKLRERR